MRYRLTYTESETIISQYDIICLLERKQMDSRVSENLPGYDCIMKKEKRKNRENKV